MDHHIRAMGGNICRCWNPLRVKRSESSQMPQEESNSNPNALDESRPLLTDHSGDIVSMESRDGPSKPINLIRILLLNSEF